MLLCKTTANTGENTKIWSSNNTRRLSCKIGRERAYKKVIRNHTLHDKTNRNGELVCEYAISNDMVIASTFFQHKYTQRNLDIPRHTNIKSNWSCTGKQQQETNDTGCKNFAWTKLWFGPYFSQSNS
jgi:hypothetical protein